MAPVNCSPDIEGSPLDGYCPSHAPGGWGGTRVPGANRAPTHAARWLGRGPAGMDRPSGPLALSHSCPSSKSSGLNSRPLITQLFRNSRTPSDGRRIVFLERRMTPVIRSSLMARYTVIVDTWRKIASSVGVMYRFLRRAEISSSDRSDCLTWRLCRGGTCSGCLSPG
jgi:hypothetical protein